MSNFYWLSKAQEEALYSALQDRRYYIRRRARELYEMATNPKNSNLRQARAEQAIMKFVKQRDPASNQAWCAVNDFIGPWLRKSERIRLYSKYHYHY
jgi:hypothetical protein